MPPNHDTHPGPAAAAFFGPRSRTTDPSTLSSLHFFLRQNHHGQALLHELTSLKTGNMWSTFAAARPDIAALKEGPGLVDMLHDWAVDGSQGKALAAERSGVIALVQLIVLQVGQYLRYLEWRGVGHGEFVEGVVDGGGGVEGCCGGLPVSSFRVVVSCY